MTALNRIPARQNEARQLQRLGAQRNLYRKAKTALVIKMWLSGGVAVALAVTALLAPELKWLTAFAGIAIYWVDFQFLSPREKDLKASAAKIQEAFDTELFGLAWPRRAGGRESAEMEIRENTAYQKVAGKYPPLDDWYSVDEALPHWAAVALCQRSNVVWDSHQRRLFVTIVKAVFYIGLGLLLLAGLCADLSSRELVPLIITLLPTGKLCLEQTRDHHDVLGRQDKIRASAEALLEDAIAKPEAATLAERAGHVQDDILEYRTRGMVVFDWLFKLIRPGQQHQMELANRQLIEQAQARQEAINRGAQEVTR